MNKSEQLCSAFYIDHTSFSIFPPGGQEMTENGDRSLPARHTVGGGGAGRGGARTGKEIPDLWLVVFKH